MDKKLPKVFASPINHKLENNKEVYYSKEEKQVSVESGIHDYDSKTIEKKINDIFSSTTYVYKAKVHIKLESGEVEKNIVGKNERYLITMDNEKIPLEDIKDIWIQK